MRSRRCGKLGPTMTFEETSSQQTEQVESKQRGVSGRADAMIYRHGLAQPSTGTILDACRQRGACSGKPRIMREISPSASKAHSKELRDHGREEFGGAAEPLRVSRMYPAQHNLCAQAFFFFLLPVVSLGMSYLISYGNGQSVFAPRIGRKIGALNSKEGERQGRPDSQDAWEVG